MKLRTKVRIRRDIFLRVLEIYLPPFPVGGKNLLDLSNQPSMGPFGLFWKSPRRNHYYRKANLSWLGNLCCPDFLTGNASPGQKGGPFVWGLATGTKGLFFFPVFLFSILFLFQLKFCISIKLMYWNSVCMISTNIYIYI